MSAQQTIRIPVTPILPPLEPLPLVEICQHFALSPEQLAWASGLPMAVMMHALHGCPISHLQARALLLGLFVLTGWSVTQGEIAGLIVNKLSFPELLMRHNMTAPQLARMAGLHPLHVQDMIRRKPVALWRARLALAAFERCGYGYQLEDVDILIETER